MKKQLCWHVFVDPKNPQRAPIPASIQIGQLSHNHFA